MYRHNLEFKPQAPFLSEAAQREVLDGRPILCVDVLFVDYAARQLLLPKRIARPAEGLWFVGGMIKRNTPPEQAAVKVVERETGTAINPEKLSFVGASWFEWDYRQDAPSENGRVDFNLCYAYEPSNQECEAIAAHLDPHEYDSAHGLQAYGRDALVAAIAGESACKQVLVDYYDLLFQN